MRYNRRMLMRNITWRVRTELLAALVVLAACGLFTSACATTGSAGKTTPESLGEAVTVTVTRGADVLRLLVVSGDVCHAHTDEQPDDCPLGRPVAHVDVVMNTAERRDVLGTTSSDGDLEIPLARIAALFKGQNVAGDQQAQLLVHDRVAAELPLGELVNRQRVIEATIAEVDDLLADPAPDRDYGQQLLARVLDLQLRGSADRGLIDRANRLYAHLRKNESIFAAPKRWFTRAKEALARLRSSGDAEAVPEQIQQNIETTQVRDTETVDAQSVSWAISMLPTMCKITVRGGAVAAGQLIATGAPGVALAIIVGSMGEDLSKWLIRSCCEMASRSTGHAESVDCSDGK
ncbi:MAG: hypothetical protein RL701_2821 [Pseudomonadota bacterium]